MTTLQFSLFFTGLLVAYMLVHLRLLRFERYLREISGLKALNERLERVAQSLERVRLDRAEQGLAQLHEDLVALAEGQIRLERALRRSEPPSTPVVTSAVTADASPGQRIRDAVAVTLMSMGYGNVRLLSDLTSATLDDRTEVVVECERNLVGYKGKVVTHNGSVVDVQMQSVTQAFP
ncbi:MAG: hypothetical protein R3F56_15130 [Planctomycetota bacterium]